MAKKTKTKSKDFVEEVEGLVNEIGADNLHQARQVPSAPSSINLTEYNDPDDNLMTAIITQHDIKHIVAFKTDIYKILNQCTAQEALMVVDKKKYEELKENLSKAIGEEIGDENTSIKNKIMSWLSDNRYKEGRDKFNIARDEYINELRQLTYNDTELLMMKDNVIRHAYDKGMDENDPKAVNYMYAFNNAVEKELERRERQADKKAGVYTGQLAPAFIIATQGDVKISYKEATADGELKQERIPNLTADAHFEDE